MYDSDKLTPESLKEIFDEVMLNKLKDIQIASMYMPQNDLLNTSPELKLQFYELVNSSQTAEELAQAVLHIGTYYGYIPGRSRAFDTETQCINVYKVIEKEYPYNMLVRSFGIRQQAMYIKYYNTVDNVK